MMPGDGYWAQRSVLITGGNGLVGSWLTQGLLRRGARVIAVVRDLNPEGPLRLLGLDDKVVIATGDVTDLAFLSRLMAQYAVRCCLHLAAQTLVGRAHSSPLDTLDSNVRGTWAVLEACRQAGVESVVIASSDKAYGSSPRLPYVESHPLLASRPYEASKACADILGRTYAATYGMAVGVTRCANIYGGGDLNETRLIPDVVMAALEGRRPVLRSDGSPVRDFMHVSDAVDAYLVLAEAASRPGVSGEAFNFGTNRPRSVLEVVRSILELAGRPDLEPVMENTVRSGDEIDAQYVDSSKAKQVLGWTARVELADGIEQTIAWYRTYLDRRLVGAAGQRGVPGPDHR
jgi:CDP-glucose 4,6-dehydratase